MTKTFSQNDVTIPQGIWSALPTFFTDDGESVWIDPLAALIRHQCRHGVQGFIAYGTTGEASSLTHSERARLLHTCLDHSQGRPVFAGIGTHNTATTIERGKEAKSLGAHGGLVVTPYYLKPTQEGLINHFRTVAESLPDLPLMLYVVPGRTGVTLDTRSLDILFDIPNIVALKDATGDLNYGAHAIKVASGRARVYSGDDPTALPFWSLGGAGSISVASNLVPAAMSGCWQDFRDGKVAEARQQFLSMISMIDGLFIEPNPVPLKYALSYREKVFGLQVMRSPLSTLTQKSTQALVELMNNEGSPELRNQLLSAQLDLNTEIYDD